MGRPSRHPLAFRDETSQPLRASDRLRAEVVYNDQRTRLGSTVSAPCSTPEVRSRPTSPHARPGGAIPNGSTPGGTSTANHAAPSVILLAIPNPHEHS